MFVLATAGHVDHGKSTLVRALTGMEPDRWAEERRRGMTIDLGYAWTQLDHRQIVFVDVPGHQRLIANMLAGLGPLAAVLFVVAADEGWRQQSGEHLAAIDALGLRHAVLAVTRSDLTDPTPALAQAQAKLATSTLESVEAVAVSGRTGAGLSELRAALARLVDRMPEPRSTGPTRLWIDRSFTVLGSGTVVTGTLESGRLAVGDTVQVGAGTHRIRGLHETGQPVADAVAVARVAVNLRGIGADEVHRGQALLSPGDWTHTCTVDVQLSVPADQLAPELMLHAGTATVAVKLRPLAGCLARLQLHQALPLVGGDRMVLRDPGAQSVLAGAQVLDIAPEPLRRRGAGRQRAAELLAGPDPLWEQRRHAQLTQRLIDAVTVHATAHPLEPGLPDEAARRQLGLSDLRQLRDVIAAAGLVSSGGRISRPGVVPSLGATEGALLSLEARLRQAPFAAPERGELKLLGLGRRELAAAVALRRLILIADDICLLPTAPALAMRELNKLTQPFTVSQAREQLASTRRVVLPLLEHLDDRGWTVRVDPKHRRVHR
jgi:selenocysteine-specific elongation factor